MNRQGAKIAKDYGPPEIIAVAMARLLRDPKPFPRLPRGVCLTLSPPFEKGGEGGFH